MPTKVKSFGHSYKLTKAQTAFFSTAIGFHTGRVACPEGMVQVDRGNEYTTYETVIEGRKHFFYEETQRTARGAAIVARRWLRGLLGLR